MRNQRIFFSFFFFQARSTYWDTFREEDEFVDSDEEGDGKDKKETKDRQKSMYNQRQIVLPAGIDIGRFIVDSLDIMPDPVRISDFFSFILS